MRYYEHEQLSLLPVPALLTRMSAPPNSLSAAETMAATPSGLATSQATLASQQEIAAGLRAHLATRKQKGE